LVEGAVQVTPSGEPIVMLADHPTTGGYPVVAVVDPDDVAIVAQALPGTTLRFRLA
jgi:allophanate hydrolase subunit 2